MIERITNKKERSIGRLYCVYSHHFERGEREPKRHSNKKKRQPKLTSERAKKRKSRWAIKRGKKERKKRNDENRNHEETIRHTSGTCDGQTQHTDFGDSTTNNTPNEITKNESQSKH